MSAYIARRLLMAVPLIAGVVIVNFVIVRLAPGDPIDVLTGDYPVPPEYAQQLREDLNLDGSTLEQLWRYLSNAVRGDFGYSYRNRLPVSDLIVERLPATILLMGTAMLVAAVVGVTLGVLASLRPYSWLDNVSSGFSLMGYSMPVFWLGQLVLLLFAVRLGWFPTQGLSSYRDSHEGFAAIADRAWHLVLPATILSFRYLAVNARITRASMLDVFQRDFMLTARSKGLSPKRVVLRHGLRNALIPIVTILGYNVAALMTGSVVVETIFGWPGIGLLLYESISARDYPVMLGVFVVAGAMAVIANLLTDVAYAVLDPRIRY